MKHYGSPIQVFAQATSGMQDDSRKEQNERLSSEGAGSHMVMHESYMDTYSYTGHAWVHT